MGSAYIGIPSLAPKTTSCTEALRVEHDVDRGRGGDQADHSKNVWEMHCEGFVHFS